MSVLSILRNTVPISLFNNQSVKIFEEVKKYGAKVVMKNNQAECVLLSPDEYLALIEEIEDAQLLALAEERLKNFDPSQLISAEEVDKKLGISAEDLIGFEDVEIE